MRLVAELRRKAEELPADGAPAVVAARQRALEAVEIVAAALKVDPTLPDADRCRREMDLLDELLRQLKPLARQADKELERRRVAGNAQDELTRLWLAMQGRTNPVAPEEMEALAARSVEIAAQIAGQAWPDWNTPRRIRQRSEAMLPGEYELERIADQLRGTVRKSLAMAYPAPEAVRLAALADQIRGTRLPVDRPGTSWPASTTACRDAPGVRG